MKNTERLEEIMVKDIKEKHQTSKIVKYVLILLLVLVLFIIGFRLLLKSFTISFDTDGGSTIRDISVSKNSSFSPNKYVPTKEGYIFLGWFKDGYKVESSFVVTRDITLVAHWENETKLTINFNSNGGSYIEPIIIELGNELVLPGTPYKDRQLFVNWVDENGVVVENGIKPEHDMTLTAVWADACPSGYKQENSLCVKYEEVDGDYQMACQNGTFDEQLNKCVEKENPDNGKCRDSFYLEDGICIRTSDLSKSLICPEGFNNEHGKCKRKVVLGN